MPRTRIPNINHLRLDELDQLIQRCTSRIKEIEAKHGRIHRKIEKIINGSGYSVERFFLNSAQLSPKAAKPLSRKAPRYQDPANPENTWAGRGRRPLWLRVAIKKGATPADFLIT